MSSWGLHSRDDEWKFVVRDGKFRGQVFTIPDMSTERSHVAGWMEQPWKQRRQRNYVVGGQVSREAVGFTREEGRGV